MSEAFRFFGTRQHSGTGSGECERAAVRVALRRLRERVARELPGDPCRCPDGDVCETHSELSFGGRCEASPGEKLAVLDMIDEELAR